MFYFYTRPSENFKFLCKFLFRIYKLCYFYYIVKKVCSSSIFLYLLTSISHSVMPDSATPWTAAHQAPLSMWFSRQGYWSGLPFPSPGDLPNPGINLGCPAMQAESLLTELQGKPLLAYSERKGKGSRSVVPDSLQPHGLSPTSLLHPWDFPGNSTGVDGHFLLQRIFPIQGWNPGLLHCRQTLYHLSHQGVTH